MPKLDPRILRLRQTLYESVQMLIDAGAALNEKAALKSIFKKLSNAKNSACGFTLANFTKFYQQYKDFKRSDYFHQNPLT